MKNTARVFSNSNKSFIIYLTGLTLIHGCISAPAVASSLLTLAFALPLWSRVRVALGPFLPNFVIFCSYFFSNFDFFRKTFIRLYFYRAENGTFEYFSKHL